MAIPWKKNLKDIVLKYRPNDSGETWNQLATRHNKSGYNRSHDWCREHWRSSKGYAKAAGELEATKAGNGKNRKKVVQVSNDDDDDNDSVSVDSVSVFVDV